MPLHPPLLLPLVVRVSIAVVFVDGGWHVWNAPAGPAVAAAPLLDRLRRVFPVLRHCTDDQLVRVNAVVHAAAGLALGLGLVPRVAAGTLAASLVPTSLAAFSFWELPEGPDRAHARAALLKNLALAGGLVGIVGATPRGDRRSSRV